MRIEDPGARVQETRRRLREYLESSDPATRLLARQFLADAAQSVDLLPYADILDRDCLNDPCWSLQVRRRQELSFGDRNSRLSILERAIRSNDAEFTPGIPLSRPSAVRMAAEQGLAELEPLAREYLNRITPARRRDHGLIGILPLFSLCGGAETLAQAPRVGAQRLLAMDAALIAERANQDEDFRAALISLASRSCRENPILGIPDACRWIRATTRRQEEFLRHGASPSQSSYPVPGPDWLRRLEEIARVIPLTEIEPLPPIKNESSAPGPPRPSGIDPCSLPEVPTMGGAIQGMLNTGYSLELRDDSGHAVDLADGIVGRRAGATIGLHLNVVTATGESLDFPAAMIVWATGKTPGKARHQGSGHGCDTLKMLWNDNASSGNLVQPERGFTYTLGESAEALASIPDTSGSGASTLWRQSEVLHIVLGEVRRNGDEFIRKAEISVPVRTESDNQSPPMTDELLRAVQENHHEAVIFLGPNLDEFPSAFRQATRVFVVRNAPHRKADRIPLMCSSYDETGKPVSRNVRVWARRRSRSSIFIAPITLIPDGDPLPSSGFPYLLLAGGAGTTECKVVKP